MPCRRRFAGTGSEQSASSIKKYRKAQRILHEDFTEEEIL